MIEARNISYKVGENIILDDVSIQLQSGRVTAILGPNGAGKSTLLKCLVGSTVPDNGLVMLEGKPLNDYSLHELSLKRAVLSQSNPISFPFVSLEIVMMGRNPYAADKQTDYDLKVAKDVLDNVDAWHLKDRIFPTLSGGEQQRVHLARVLAQLWEQKNAYLFLDEPTSALDLKHQHQVLGLVKSISEKRNIAVCIILHDINLACRYANDSILLKDGRLFVSGETPTVLTHDNIEEVFEIPAEYVFNH